MKFIQALLAGIFFIVLVTSCSAQRDASTSSARAAYSVPSSGSYHANKVKKRNKKIKSASAKKAARKRNSDASVLRKRPVGM